MEQSAQWQGHLMRKVSLSTWLPFLRDKPYETMRKRMSCWAFWKLKIVYHAVKQLSGQAKVHSVSEEVEVEKIVQLDSDFFWAADKSAR